MDLLRATRKTQATPTTQEWNGSGSYGHHPIFLSMTSKKARPAWWSSLGWALLAGTLGLAGGRFLSGPAPLPAAAPAPPPVAAAPAPVAAAPAPVVSLATEPLGPPAPVAPVRSTKASRCLALGWEFYGEGAYDRASDMAMEALEAVGREHGTAMQRAQAKGLLEASQARAHSNLVPQVVRVQVAAPQPAARPQVVPAIAQDPAPQSDPVPEFQPESEPAPLPETSYPKANPRASRTSSRVPMPTRPVVPQIPFQRVSGPVLPNGIPYPTGRGPGVCPNYLVNDDCECHQFERGFQRVNSFAGRSFTPSYHRSTSRMESWRRSESLLYSRI